MIPQLTPLVQKLTEWISTDTANKVDSIEAAFHDLGMTIKFVADMFGPFLRAYDNFSRLSDQLSRWWGNEDSPRPGGLGGRGPHAIADSTRAASRSGAAGSVAVRASAWTSPTCRGAPRPAIRPTPEPTLRS